MKIDRKLYFIRQEVWPSSAPNFKFISDLDEVYNIGSKIFIDKEVFSSQVVLSREQLKELKTYIDKELQCV